MDRKLVTIRQIDRLEPIHDADAIECAHIGGWQVVVKKGEFKPGDPCVFFEIDSLLPHSDPRFEFMRPRGFRVKTVKLRGCLSQGLALPVSVFPGIPDDAPYMCDCTEFLGVIKYEPPVPACLAGHIKGAFPGFLVKTDQERIQNLQPIVDQYQGKVFSCAEKLDGCLAYGSLITTDRGQVPIGRIVNAKLPVQVLTYNEDLKTVEFKPIAHYHKYECAGKAMVSIGCGVRGKGNRQKYINCTVNHEFFTSTGWKPAGELHVGDTIYHLVNVISEEIEQIVLGICIGDGHIHENERETVKTLHFSHCDAQSGYMNYISTLLGPMYRETIPRMGGYPGSTLQRRGMVRSNLSVQRLIEKYVFRDGKRIITPELCNKLSPIGIAFWYMDDGSISHRNEDKQKPRAMFNTQRYSKEEVILLMDMLKRRFNIDSTLGDAASYKGYVINLTTEGTQILSSLIAPYVCKCMKYKLPKKYEYLTCVYDCVTFEALQNIVTTNVLSIGPFDNTDIYSKFIYDLTVEDNHNYFCNNILIHNSSFTCYLNDGQFGVCSRNLELLETADNTYWKVARFYNLEEILRSETRPLAIQGEVIGFGIQKNRYALKTPELYIFDIYDIDKGKYYTNLEIDEFCIRHHLTHVPFLQPIWMTGMETMIQLAEGLSVINPKIQREGIVLRNYDNGRVSFKIINNKYLLRYEE